MRTGLAGGALLALPAAARWLASASESAVYVAGHELPRVCVFSLLFGVRCPGCGMTRSVLLTLGGDLRGALATNPGGPLLVLGLALLGTLLLVRALRAPAAGQEPARRRLAPWVSAYAAVVSVAMVAHWAAAFVRR